MKSAEMLQNSLFYSRALCAVSGNTSFPNDLFPHNWEVAGAFQRRGLLPHSDLLAEVIEGVEIGIRRVLRCMIDPFSNGNMNFP